VPELPEVETVRRSLTPHLVGETILSATLFRADICETHDQRPATDDTLLAHATIARIDRKGKQLALIATDGRVLNIHLGMSGQVLIRDQHPEATENHVHALWTTSGSRAVMIFKDPRRFGGLWTFPTIDLLNERRWSLLGPDALDALPSVWAPALRRGDRAVKAALLDQRAVAGVGNIYADEALFRIGIRPTTRTKRLSIAASLQLATTVRSVLAESVAARGSTLRDYRDADGFPGRQQLEHRVYGRSGQTCLTCGSRLRGGQVGQRTTVWCPKCQPSQTKHSERVKL